MKRKHSIYIFNNEINAGKMIFLSGPRQVGKTTFILKKLESKNQKKLYFKWDDPYWRRKYLKIPSF